MEKNMELAKLSNEELLDLYKKVDDYVVFLDKEKEKNLKGTEE
jgi:hypothetical protein